MAHAEHRLALSLRDIDDPDPKVAEVLTQAKAGLGMIPNMYAAMANAPALLDTYLTGYEVTPGNPKIVHHVLGIVVDPTVDRGNGKTNADAAWFYPQTSAAAKSIEGRVAFWKGVSVTDG